MTDLDEVKQMIEEIEGTWSSNETKVIAIHHEVHPVVASTPDGFKLLHDKILDPRRIERSTLIEKLQQDGGGVQDLRLHEHRFTKEMFEWPVPSEKTA